MEQQEVARKEDITEEIGWLRRTAKHVGADPSFVGPKAFLVIKAVFKEKNSKLGMKMHIYSEVNPVGSEYLFESSYPLQHHPKQGKGHGRNLEKDWS